MRLVRLLTVLFFLVVPLQGVEVPYRIFSLNRGVVVPLQGVEVSYRIFSPHGGVVVPVQGVEVSYRIFSLDRGVVRRLWVDRRVVHRATPLAWLSPPEALPALQTKQEGPA